MKHMHTEKIADTLNAKKKKRRTLIRPEVKNKLTEDMHTQVKPVEKPSFEFSSAKKY